MQSGCEALFEDKRRPFLIHINLTYAVLSGLDIFTNVTQACVLAGLLSDLGYDMTRFQRSTRPEGPKIT